jgi:hypothetical protein
LGVREREEAGARCPAIPARSRRTGPTAPIEENRAAGVAERDQAAGGAGRKRFGAGRGGCGFAACH